MKKIETVGLWYDEDGNPTNIVVNYDDGDVMNFLPGCLPLNERTFALNAPNKDRINLSDGKRLIVCY